MASLFCFHCWHSEYYCTRIDYNEVLGWTRHAVIINSDAVYLQTLKGVANNHHNLGIEECLCNQLALQPVVTFTQDIVAILTGARRSSRITPIRVGMSDQDFINACFPYPHQAHLRDQLANLLQQPWLNSNYEEPPHALRFLLSEADSVNPKCKICSRVLRRGGRALEHLRIHLDHTPFRCLGSSVGCSQPNCARVFHGRESMRDHQRKVQVQCNQCQIRVLRKNFRRHQQSHPTS